MGAGSTLAYLDSAPTVESVQDRSAPVLVVAAVLVLLLICGAVVVGVRAARGTPRKGSGRGLGRHVALALVFLLLGAVAASGQVLLLTRPPLAAWIDHKATAEVIGEVTAEARVVTARSARAWGPRSWQEVSVQAESIAARGMTVSGSVPLTIRLPVDVGAPVAGSRVAWTGRLSRVPLRTGAAARVEVGSRPAVPLTEPGPIPAAAQAMRSGLRAALSETDPEAAALVAGLAVGDESGQSPDLAEAMRASGLSHLTAVSGGNVAIAMGVVLLAARAARLRLGIRVGVALAALAYFVVLVGREPSVLRAATMGAITVSALLVGGRRVGPSVLAVGVLVLVTVMPALALSWAFALSVFATAGLILIAPGVGDRLARLPWVGRWGSAPREALALTVSAQLAALPVLVAMGGAAGWVAVPANLAAMPVVPAITVLGLAAALISPALPAAAAVLGWLAAWPALWIARVATTSADAPGSAVPWPEGWSGVLALVATGAGVVAGWRVARRLPVRLRMPALVGSGLVVALVVAAPAERRGWPPDGWLAIMCDVGQGDALAVRVGPGAALVVDAGPDPDAVDACLSDAGVTAVPMLVVSHFHADHAAGLAGVLRGRPVARAVLPPLPEPAEEAAAVLERLSRAAVPATAGMAGDRWQVAAATVEVIAPRRLIEAGSRPNNASIVLVVTVGERSLLLTGDIETEAQVAIAADLAGRSFDVVKVPHHGSARQDDRFPGWVGARLALISVGEGNGYGQPAESTVQSWAAAGALVVRTDVSGDVAVVERGADLVVVTRTAPRPS